MSRNRRAKKTSKRHHVPTAVMQPGQKEWIPGVPAFHEGSPTPPAPIRNEDVDAWHNNWHAQRGGGGGGGLDYDSMQLPELISRAGNGDIAALATLDRQGYDIKALGLVPSSGGGGAVGVDPAQQQFINDLAARRSDLDDRLADITEQLAANQIDAADAINQRNVAAAGDIEDKRRFMEALQLKYTQDRDTLDREIQTFAQNVGVRGQDITQRQQDISGTLDASGQRLQAQTQSGQQLGTLAGLEQSRQTALREDLRDPRNFAQLMQQFGGGNTFIDQVLAGQAISGQSATTGLPALTPADNDFFAAARAELGQTPAFDLASAASQQLGGFQTPELPGQVAGLGPEAVLTPDEQEIFRQFMALAPNTPVDIAINIARNPAAARTFLEALPPAPPGGTPPGGQPRMNADVNGDGVIDLQNDILPWLQALPSMIQGGQMTALDVLALQQLAASAVVQGQPLQYVLQATAGFVQNAVASGDWATASQQFNELSAAAAGGQEVGAGQAGGKPADGFTPDGFQPVGTTNVPAPGLTSGDPGFDLNLLPPGSNIDSFAAATGAAQGSPVLAFMMDIQKRALTESAATGVPFNEVHDRLNIEAAGQGLSGFTTAQRTQFDALRGGGPARGFQEPGVINFQEVGRNNPNNPLPFISQSTGQIMTPFEVQQRLATGRHAGGNGVLNFNPGESAQVFENLGQLQLERSQGLIGSFDPSAGGTSLSDIATGIQANTLQSLGAPEGFTGTEVGRSARAASRARRNSGGLAGSILSNISFAGGTGNGSIVVDEPTVAIGMFSGEKKFTLGEPTQQFPNGIPELVSPQGNGIRIDPPSFAHGGSVALGDIGPIRVPDTFQPQPPLQPPPPPPATPFGTGPTPENPGGVNAPSVEPTALQDNSPGAFIRNLLSLNAQSLNNLSPSQQSILFSIGRAFGVPEEDARFSIARAQPRGLDPSRVLTAGF